ncbi:protein MICRORCHIDIA 7-like [Rutidosis leptorrhynchoides]|uniref:protein MICRORCHIDIA 7-like n=1 Tax=Rutidosis leptorrhynchoides TaxID=125765 RepID=UPI003A991D0A
MAEIKVKEEYVEVNSTTTSKYKNASEIPVIDLEDSASDSDSGDDVSSSGDGNRNGKRSRVPNEVNNDSNKRNKRGNGVVLPEGFLDPLPNNDLTPRNAKSSRVCKQFWKADDFDGLASGNQWNTSAGGMDHLRVHPRFLHSNATSHKWVLGAFAELLDNSLDEVGNGATYVKVDMLENKKTEDRMLLIEDNGGGMDPDKMRHCMSLGYSLKSKVKDTIGQYGNGFKTSTMRLGADVVVFSRCSGKYGKRSTQSIGLLSYTFLRSTGKEDIVVPMLDYEKSAQEWKKMARVSANDWNTNLEALVQWSPFSSETELLRQFDHMKDQGTRIIIYNLWEDDQGQLELDFDTDKHDIQIRGVNRDEKNIEMAQKYPNSRHFLTYRHSLRSYASILYLRVPYNFRMILRGKDVEHHNIINDMMLTTEVTYKPQPNLEGLLPDSNMSATVTVGFVKDARSHIDVQGFNVYHKNRLIKPFWRLWNAAGSDGRGVIGVLEANFVEPAHDKQGFERTNVLQRLETKLIQTQKKYWSENCDKIGYAPRRNKIVDDRDTFDEHIRETPSRRNNVTSERKIPTPQSDKIPSRKHQNGVGASSSESTSHLNENDVDDDLQTLMTTRRAANGNSSQKEPFTLKTRSMSAVEVRNQGPEPSVAPNAKDMQVVTPSYFKSSGVNGNVNGSSSSNNKSLEALTEENRELKERLKKREEEILGDLQHDLDSEKNRCKELELQLEEERQKCEVLNKEQDSIIAIFQEERGRRDNEEEALRKKLKDAEVTINKLKEKLTELQLEKMKSMGHKWTQ